MTRTAYELAEEALRLARALSTTIATAESCTGGLLASTLVEVPNSSQAFDRGFITYSNAAKHDLLDVPEESLKTHGAVSEPVARAMAEGVLKAARAGLSIAVTGIAGPTGGTPDKPVGLVHFAAAREGRPTLHREKRFGDIGRGEVRRQSVIVALELLCEAAGETRTA